jgi:hypothetical protein
MRASVESIRARGFKWPRHPEIEKHAVAEGSLIDLDATLAKLEKEHAFYDREIGKMHDFAREWNAPVDDITDNRDAYGEARIALADAIRHVKQIRDALARLDK